jgi:hypothetical protein
LYNSEITVLVDAAFHSEHGKVIKYDFKLEIYKSTPKEGYLSRQQQAILSTSATNKS